MSERKLRELRDAIADVIGYEEYGSVPRIEFQERSDGGGAWVAFLPGEYGCICDDFSGAASLVGRFLKTRKGARYR